MNYVMGWIRKADSIKTSLIKRGKKGLFYLNIYNYKMVNHKIICKRHVSLIDREKIFKTTSMKEVKRGTRDELGVELGPNLSVEGIVYPTIRHANQQFKFSDAEMLGSILEIDPSYMNNINMEGFYASGSWHTSKADIERFGESDGLDLSHWDFFYIVKDKIQTLKFPVITRVPQASEVYTQGVNPHSDSGFHCSYLFGKTKGKAFEMASDISYKLFNKVREKFIPDCSLWTVGGRERLHTPDEDGNCEIKSRAVLSPEMVVSQICQIFARPITDQLSLINEEDFNYPLHLGSDMFQGKFMKLVEKCKTFKNTICTDWSRYDQSIKRGQIVLAFAICRSAFPKSRYVDNLFLFMLSSFIIKRVVGDGGIVYKITKGVATGHPFTSIINTLVNFITFSYLEKECNIDFQFKKFYGDDTILSSDDENIKFEMLREASLRNFGMVLKLESDTGFIIGDDIENSACFLKYRSLYGLPSRSKTDLIKTISFFRKRYLRRNSDKFLRGLSFLYAAPFDLNYVRIIKTYCSKFKINQDNQFLEDLTRDNFDEEFGHYHLKAIEFLTSSSRNETVSKSFNTDRWLPGDEVKSKEVYQYSRIFV